MATPRAALLAFSVPLLLAAAPAAAQVSIAAGDFAEKVEVHVVNVDVVVTDRDGRPVAGLQAKDFELLEDGRPVAISHFAASSQAGPPPAPAAPGPAAAPPEAAPAAPAADVPEEDRLHLAVVFDNLNLAPHNRTRILDDLRRFLADGLAPTDRVLLMTWDRGLAVRQPFTSDRAALGRALDQISTSSAHGNDLERERRSALQTILSTRQVVMDSGGSPCDPRIAQPVFTYAESARSQVLQTIGGLTLVVNSLSGVPGRKALLYVSDGFPVTPGEEMFQVLYEICGGGGIAQGLPGGVGGAYDAALLDPEDYQGSQALIDAQRYTVANDLRRLTAHANAQRVPLYTLQASGLRGAASGSAEYGGDERVLQLPSVELVATSNLRNSLNVLAADTGGRAIFDASQVGVDLARMRTDLAAGYSLGFVAEHGGDGREHKLEVRVKRPGLQVRFPRSYRAKPARERIVDRTLASLLHGVEENPLELQVLPGEPTPATAADTFRAPIRLRIPLSKLAILTRPDLFEGHLKLYVVARDGEGRTSPMREIDVPIRIPREQVLTALGQYFAYDVGLTLRPGEHRVAIAVHDEYGDVTSYVGTDLRVAALAAR